MRPGAAPSIAPVTAHPQTLTAMPKKSPQDTNARRIAIIELIAATPLPVEEIVEQLIPKAGRRTVYEDLKRESAGKGHGVDWIKTLPLDQAIKEKGFFGQNSVAKPKAKRWIHTIERLKKRFEVE